MRIRTGTWLVYVAVLCAVALVSFLIWHFSVAPEGDAGPAGPPADGGQEPEPGAEKGLRVAGGELVERDAEGKIIWQVKADGEFTYDEKAGVARGSDVAFAVVLEDERDLRIGAPRFEVRYADNTATFTGGIMVGSRKPEAAFKAESATYDIKKHVLSATEGVRGALKERGMQFEAGSLEYDLDGEAFVAGGGVVVRQGHFEARADEVTVDLRKRQTHWHGDVRMAWRR